MERNINFFLVIPLNTEIQILSILFHQNHFLSFLSLSATSFLSLFPALFHSSSAKFQQQSNSVITMTVTTNNKNVSIFWSQMITHGYNVISAITNKHGRSQVFVITEFECIRKILFKKIFWFPKNSSILRIELLRLF